MANVEPELAEIGTIVTSLKEGTTMTRFYSNKRPETRIFLLKLDEFQIGWWRNAGREEGTGTVAIETIVCENFVASLSYFSIVREYTADVVAYQYAK